MYIIYRIYVYNLSRLVLLPLVIRLSSSHVTRKKKMFYGSSHEKEVSSASSSFSELSLWILTTHFLLLGLSRICIPISICVLASLPCNMNLAMCPVSCHCLCSVELWQSVLSCKVLWHLQTPVEMKVLSLLNVALKRRPVSEQSIFLLSRTSCKDAGSVPWKYWDGEGLLLKSCIRRESRLGGVGRLTCFFPLLSPFHLEHGNHCLLLSLGLSISLEAIFHGSKQACLFLAVLKSWHWHSTGGQKTGAGSMWYLVSVIFCNTYTLSVEMAEVSVLVSHSIHLASPCCM